MKSVLTIILPLITIIGSVGCSQKDKTAVNDFRRVGDLVFVNPDSAAVVLDGIRRDDLGDDASLSRYDLLRTIIDDRLGILHQSSDAILSARNYFVEVGNTSDSLLSIVHLYTGRVYEDMGEYEKALESYLVARTHSENTTANLHLKGRIAYNIGYLYRNDGDYAHSSLFLEQAIGYFNAEGDILNTAHSYNLLGANHTVSGNVEEGLVALSRAGEIYGRLRDTSGMNSNTLIMAGLYLHHLNDVSKADSVMSRVHREYNNGIIPQGHLPVMSEIEAGKGNYGKAVELIEDYLDLSHGLPLEERAIFYPLISYYDSQAGKYSSAYNHLSEYVNVIDSLYDDKMVTILQEVEKKYEKQTLENEYEAYRKIVFYRILVSSILSLAVISVLIISIKRRRQKYLDMEIDIERLTSQISELDDLRDTLSNVLDQKVERETRLQEVLTNKIQYIKSIAEYLFVYDKRPQDFKRKIDAAVIQAGKDKYFGELQEVVNEKYAGIVDYLKHEYPTLTEDELNICSLVCFGFHNNEIGVLFGYTNANSIFNKRHRLRKKLGLWPKYESLEAYLSNLVSDLQSGAADCAPTGEELLGD